jgi:2-amino-4-hydroxy-6-hydroxymethyldihydropteridine diphosphokinase
MAAALRILDGDPHTDVVAVSSLYRTPPWGKTDQPDFLNAAAEIATSHAPRALLALCLDAERALKRERRERWGPRIIDIDILLFGDRAVHEAGLDIPHPRMLERAFVLAPLAEIAPDLPISGKPVSAWLAAVDATGVVRQKTAADWWKSIGA